MPRCLIALGSNLGDRRDLLQRALDLLQRHPSIAILSTSRWIETPSVGGPPGQQPFLNGAATLETSLPPDALLEALGNVERQLGRDRLQRWGPRTIDLDLLLYASVVQRGPNLTLPHPRMAWRRFVLEPAAEVAADMVHPTSGWTVAALWAHLQTAKPYVAVADPWAEGTAALATQLADALGGTLLPPPASPLLASPSSPPPAPPECALRLCDLLVEYGRGCVQRLPAESPQWAAPLVVSRFWIEEARALAEAMLPAAEFREFVDRWESLTAGVVRPKLVVVLDAGPSGSGAGGSAPSAARGDGAAADRVASYSAAIRRWARRPGHGPVFAPAELVARGIDPADYGPAVFAELQAAVEAMGS